jgi:hypothetical protein
MSRGILMLNWKGEQRGSGTTASAADSGGWRSAFRSDVDHDSEVMPISIPN